MEQLRVKGLSCANCTRELEQEIQKLEHGEGATLSYNSGRLTVHPKVSLVHVAKILKQEGAYLEQIFVEVSSDKHSHEHGNENKHSLHDNEHNHSHDDHEHTIGGIHLKLIGAAIIFGIGLLLQNQLPSFITIGFFLMAMVLGGYATWFKGLKNLLRFRFNIDTLMTLALVGAVCIGQWEEATTVALLFGLNELLEGMGMEKARRSMEALLKAAPKAAILFKDGQEITVPIASLNVGDIVVIRPGDQIPSDGFVKEGSSSLNEAAITGESLPVEKAIGDPVFGGSLNNESVLKVTISKTYEDSSLAKILHLVEEAQDSKTPTQLFIQRFAEYYTPVIMIIAVLAVIIPPLLFNGNWKDAIYQGLAVLIVGCPCALILSSPIAIVAGITRNARNGILIKGGAYLEQLGKINTIAFDKTGTLTKGEPSVEKVVVYDQKRFYGVAACMEKNASHPLSQAILMHVRQQAAEADGVNAYEADHITAVPGQGITASVNGEKFWLGNEKAVAHIRLPENVQTAIDQLKQQAFTLVLLADQAQVLGIFGIADQIRPESRAVITQLHRQGIQHTVMLTGDHKTTAEKIAKIVGVKEYYADLLPEDKVSSIQKLAARGGVAMVGDGINDAPALAAAQLGIAMGKGTDSAMETADIILLQDHLGKLPEAISIAKRVNRLIKWNISIALGLKLIALLLTIPGLLTLWIAVLSDMGATIFVSLLSLTILIQGKSFRVRGISK
ncbi:MAG: cadA [Bacilli bacterium]|nr:cadA [Bacilli bacterium]